MVGPVHLNCLGQVWQAQTVPRMRHFVVGRLYSFVLVTVWWALRPPILQAWEQLKRAIAFVECRRRVVECRLLYPPLYLSLKIALHSITKSRIHRSSLMAITLIFGLSAREFYFQRWDVILT